MNPLIRKLVQEALRVGSHAAVNAFRNAVKNERPAAGHLKYIYGSGAQQGMGLEEAQKVLDLPRLQGLDPREVERRAERFLAQNDPESGGSAFLRAKVAEARRAVLAELSRRSQP